MRNCFTNLKYIYITKNSTKKYLYIPFPYHQQNLFEVIHFLIPMDKVELVPVYKSRNADEVTNYRPKFFPFFSFYSHQSNPNPYEQLEKNNLRAANLAFEKSDPLNLQQQFYLQLKM